MPDNDFLDQVKRIIIRVPGTQKLNRIRHEIIRIRELSTLINENRIVVLHPYSRMEMGKRLSYEIVHDVVKDLLQVYGTLRLKRTTAAAIESPTDAILLYAPLALLRIPFSHGEYLRQVGNKTRNMIRKADRQGYEFKEFVWNDHLDEIYEINTSKEIRQSEPMRDWYQVAVQSRFHSKRSSNSENIMELSRMEYYVLIYIPFCVEISLSSGTLWARPASPEWNNEWPFILDGTRIYWKFPNTLVQIRGTFKFIKFNAFFQKALGISGVCHLA